MTLFERFLESKEEGFRDDFVQPLLVQMGFCGISNKHGSQEFGKDFVFSEIGPFGSFRHMVVQAKHIRKLTQGVAIDDLVSQIKQCFHVAYTVPFAPDDVRHVSAVYVFNTGEITENAKDQMVSMLDTSIRSNVFVFGGHQLEAIERTGMYRRLEEIRRSVASLRAQLGFNIEQWRMAQRALKPQSGPPSWLFGRSFIAGIELHLANPVLPEIIPIKDLGAIWSNIGILEQIHTKHIVSPRDFSGEVERDDIATVFDLIDRQLIPIAIRLSQRIEAWILTLPVKDF